MAEPTATDATILIASDNAPDAALVQKLLSDEFEHILTSTDPDKTVEDFDRHQPGVLILAFNTIDKAQRYYLGIYRFSTMLPLQPHRTILLCNKNELSQAYKRCREGLFDDYVFFWPIVHDAMRLPMSVYVAQRELAALVNAGPSVAEFAEQARRLSALEPLLDQQVVQASKRIKSTGRAVAQAEHDIGRALDGLSRQLVHGVGADTSTNIEDLVNGITRLKEGEIRQGFETVAESVQPLQQWADGFQQACEPHLASVRSLNSLVQSIRPTVLVVDDDEFQRKLVSKILEGENYHIVFAASGIEALNTLRSTQPDLILMDIMMPDMDGMEVTRKVKAMPHLVDIPIIMCTARSEKNTVTASLKSGATDFIVKPFVRVTLIAKVASVLCARNTPK
jgi:CheY-like chemotaxis protein